MKKPALFCELCGELPATKDEPKQCPKCGGEIQATAGPGSSGETAVKILTPELPPKDQKPKTKAERAAWWFQKMREIVAKAP